MPAKEDDSMAFRRKIYTSGTLYEKETGNYYSDEGMRGIPGADESKAKRPVGHGKKAATGKAAPILRGAKVAGAQRGVGQPTIDGFINGLTGERRFKRKK